MARQCFQCEHNARKPTRIPMTPWLFPQRPWSRIHLDYAGPTEGKMIFVVVDAYSKWIDTVLVKSANMLTTIEELRKLFSIQGIPEIVVTDNAACFTSDEFKQCDAYTNTGISSIIEWIGRTSSPSFESWIEENDKWLNGDQTSSISSNISSYKGSFYIAQYPVCWTAQSALHFCPPWQTCSFRHQLGFSGKHSSDAAITRKD